MKSSFKILLFLTVMISIPSYSMNLDLTCVSQKEKSKSFNLSIKENDPDNHGHTSIYFNDRRSNAPKVGPTTIEFDRGDNGKYILSRSTGILENKPTDPFNSLIKKSELYDCAEFNRKF
jgi:hypothetical protein